jgi:hypothetical protein
MLRFIIVAFVSVVTSVQVYAQAGDNAAIPGLADATAPYQNTSILQQRAASRTTQVSGTLLPVFNTCGGEATAISTRFSVTQKGRNFTVRTPARLVLKGKGGRSGFRVTARTTSSGVQYFHELTVGAVTGFRTAAVRLSISARASNGAQCSVAYEGSITLLN